MITYLIRARRADPGGLADGDASRSALCTAALQQFEDLMAAASAIGPAARPLPLFYALSQAGRALLAIWSRDEDAVSGQPDNHGLSTGRAPNGGEHGLLLTKESPAGHPSRRHFDRVATAINSPVLTDEIDLGALLASLPEMTDYRILDDWPVVASFTPLHNYDDPSNSDGLISTVAVGADAIQSLEEFELFNHKYPSLARFDPAIYNGRTQELPRYYTVQSEGGLSVQVDFHLPDRDAAKWWDDMAPEYRWSGRRWIRPSFDGANRPPIPLMTWWAALHAVSNLARYQPVAWTAAIDRNSSKIAVLLERFLDLALEVIPHLFLEALMPPENRPLLLPPGPNTPPVHQ